MFIAATAVLLAVWGASRFGLGKTSVAALFDYPPDYPGYTWTRNGQAVSPQELDVSAGGKHCNWQSVTFLTVGWPLGTHWPDSSQARQYVRDPDGVVKGGYVSEKLVLRATLPGDALPTGYRHASVQLFLSPSDDDLAIYVVGPDATERWPRSNPRTGCI
jgi:hypothetical protein